MRTAKELLIASKEFAHEYRGQSWWHLLSTLGLLSILIAIAVSQLPLALRLAASLTAGLVAVRMFIIYHDFQHGAILSRSPLARGVMFLYGLLALSPPSVWNRSHNHHHKYNSRSLGDPIGSFPLMTRAAYDGATRVERFAYLATRHPLTLLGGYFSVFLWNMSLRPFFTNPRLHWDGGVTVLLHLALLLFTAWCGLGVMGLGVLLPLMTGSGLGAYLFYAQHNFPSAKMNSGSTWNHVDAALHSSSYMLMNPLMQWLTGNIGYHHVHHLNARIPFYRLPEAMSQLEELQSPGVTSLHPRDVAACLRLKFWCPDEDRLVTFQESLATRVPVKSQDL